jgi:hypothetical protein
MDTCRLVLRAFSLCILLALTAGADTRDRKPVDVTANVIKLLFPFDVASRPFYVRLALRFGDSNTQLVALIYPGGECELIHYRLTNIDGTEVNGDELLRLVSAMVSQNPRVRELEIATKFRVEINRSNVEYKNLDRALTNLKAIKVSPFLGTRIAVDEYSQYDFWFDSGQESVHYTITGPFKDAPQDQLVQWMIKFRATFGDSR